MKTDIDITQKEYEIIKGILTKYLPKTCKIWVFGSRAKNKTRFNSDLDLAIEDVEQLTKKQIYDLEQAFIESTLPYEVDIIDMKNISDSFKKIVQEEAIKLDIE
ncbi:MAG: hypothetical protein RLZZ210_854 [Pseudomonadota bacterium]|jgi:predicted nucleotidyltransferase